MRRVWEVLLLPVMEGKVPRLGPDDRAFKVSGPLRFYWALGVPRWHYLAKDFMYWSNYFHNSLSSEKYDYIRG